ncbi:MAG: hypothetical protein JWO83_764, partial [Caulobacteraceae bacterium]|nr:hypothetical protein [Caulobacteraceae bacterium]
SLIIVLELMFAGGFEMTNRWPPKWFFTTGLISTLSFLFIVGVCVVGIVQAHRRKDRLVIDETGVLLDQNGVSRAWRWTDMARFHLVVVHAPSKLRMVAIEPPDHEAFDAKANVIWPKFGPSTEEFLGLLRAGKARWGPD